MLIHKCYDRVCKIFSIFQTNIIIIFFIIIFLCAVFIGIDNEPLWLDEAETLMWSHVPLLDLPTVTADSNHMPTYYAIVHGWRLIGNDSEMWLRILPALFIASSIPIIYLLGRIIANNKAGIFSMLVFASSPYIFRFAQETRPYAMLVFFGAVAILCLSVHVRDLIHKKSPNIIGMGWKQHQIKNDLLWVIFVLCTLIMIITHHTALLFPFIAFGSYFIVSCFSIYWKIYWFNIGIAILVLGVMYLPFLPLFITSFGIFEQNSVYIRHGIIQLLSVYGNALMPITTLPIICCSVIFVLWRWLKGNEWQWAFILMSFWIGMLALVLLIGIEYGSVFKERIFIWTFIPLAIMAGVGISMVKWSHVVISLLIIFNLVAIFIYNVGGDAPWDGITNMIAQQNKFGIFVQNHTYAKTPWDEISSHISRQYEKGDTIVLCPDYSHKVFFIYWNKYDIDMWGYNLEKKEVYQMYDLNSNISFNMRTSSTYPVEILDARYDRIWSISRMGNQECLGINYGKIIEHAEWNGFTTEVFLYDTDRVKNWE